MTENQHLTDVRQKLEELQREHDEQKINYANTYAENIRLNDRLLTAEMAQDALVASLEHVQQSLS